MIGEYHLEGFRIDTEEFPLVFIYADLIETINMLPLLLPDKIRICFAESIKILIPEKGEMYMSQVQFTEEQMRDFLEIKGYVVGGALDLFAKANAMNFEYNEKSELWSPISDPHFHSGV